MTGVQTCALPISGIDAENPVARPDVWEKVIRKLRARTMPPSPVPKPDEATYNMLADFLESKLDAAAEAKPDPGRTVAAHRLNRAEYANAIRDLLALDIDTASLLPSDDSGGFDNLGALLSVSPGLMERYLSAAGKISRLAVGDPKAPLMASTYRLSPEQWQEDRVEELPYGTRGGLAIHSEFPIEGQYNFKVDVAGGGRDAHDLVILVDGEELASVASNSGRGKPLEVRVPVKAGPHVVGVTFVERNRARDENTLRPRLRGRGNGPAVASVLVSGPYEAKGPGETPSRARIFSCRPTNAADELPCAQIGRAHV